MNIASNFQFSIPYGHRYCSLPENVLGRYIHAVLNKHNRRLYRGLVNLAELENVETET
jgi:hypothetical protein